MTLGERIKEQRKSLGFSQEKIAELVGTSQQTVTEWETNQSIPSMENLITLSKILELSLNELSSGDSENTPVEVNAELNPKVKPKKKPFLMDAVFILVAIFAAWNILNIPSLIGFSIVGFFTIVIQAIAVLYIPLYLLLIRPYRTKIINEKQANNDINTAKRSPLIERLPWAFGAVASLWVCYFVWYILASKGLLPGLNWRFMDGWSFTLLIVGLIVVIIATLKFSRKTMIGTVVGFCLGFIAAVLFGSDITHPSGTMGYNNAWQIWTIVYFVCIILGIVWEILSKRFSKNAVSQPSKLK